MADVHLIGEIVSAEGVGGSWQNRFRLGGGQGLWCRWEISVGTNGRWEKQGGALADDGRPACVNSARAAAAEGAGGGGGGGAAAAGGGEAGDGATPSLAEYGQTQVCVCKPGGRADWYHPIDVHYTTTSMVGWPRLVLEIWSQDNDGRNELAGYATANIPAAQGVYDIEVPCWRPVAEPPISRWTFGGMWSALNGVFLGVWPRLKGGVNEEGKCKGSVAKSVIHNTSKERTPQSLTTVGTGKARVKVTVITRGLSKHGPGLAVNLAGRGGGEGSEQGAGAGGGEGTP